MQDKVEICPDPAPQQPDVMKVGRPQDRKHFQATYGTAYDDAGEVNNRALLFVSGTPLRFRSEASCSR